MHRLVFAVAIICVSMPAHAESGNSRAKMHYDRGTEAYERHEYDLAIEEFRKSLIAGERASTCYALGLAGEAAHRADIAVVGFRRYLALAPMGPVQLHDHAAAYVSEFDLRAHRANELERERQIEHDRLIAAAPARSSGTPRTAWAALSLLVVSLGVAGAGAGVLGHSTTIDPDKAGITLTQHQNLITQANNEQIAGISLLAVGGAALISSAACFGSWMVHRRRHRNDVRVGVAPIGGAYLTVGGEF